MEQEQLNFTLQMTYEDYKAFVQFTERYTDLAPDSRKIVAAGLVLAALGAVIRFLTPVSYTALGSMILGGGCIIGILGGGVMANAKRRKYLRLPDTVRAAQHMVFEDDRCMMVSYAAPDRPVHMAWNECRGCIETETHFYIVNLHGQTVLMPKKQMEGKAQEAAAFLKGKFGSRYMVFDGTPIKIKKGLRA